MNIKNIFSTALTLFLTTGLSYAQNDLSIEISNIEKVKGQILIGLFNSGENFPDREGQYKSIAVPVDGKSVQHVFEDLPSGDYAAAICHDVNSDKKCNRNFIGIPTEAYGFSQNYVPKISAPSFEETKVSVEGKTSIGIELIQ